MPVSDELRLREVERRLERVEAALNGQVVKREVFEVVANGLRHDLAGLREALRELEREQDQRQSEFRRMVLGAVASAIVAMGTALFAFVLAQGGP